MKLFLAVIIGALFAVSSSAQDLPAYGSIEDLNGKTKAYIVADAVHSKIITKEIKKQKIVQIVGDPKDAEFFIEFKILSVSEPASAMGITTQTGQMDVYINDGSRKNIAWRQASANSLKVPSSVLIKKFLKELSRKDAEQFRN